MRQGPEILDRPIAPENGSKLSRRRFALPHDGAVIVDVDGRAARTAWQGAEISVRAIEGSERSSWEIRGEFREADRHAAGVRGIHNECGGCRSGDRERVHRA